MPLIMSSLIIGALCFIGTTSGSIGLTELNAEYAAIVLRESRPGIDYPIFDTAPKTSFSCLAPNIVPGRRYSDIDTGCQVFHVCDEARVDTTYICPNMTIFNDQSQVCEWFHQVDCKQVYKPAITTVILSPAVSTTTTVVEAKPNCITTCSNAPTLTPVIQSPASSQQSTEFNIIQSSARVPRPLAPVAVLSTIPIRPATENTIQTTAVVPVQAAAVASQSQQSAQFDAIQSAARAPRPLAPVAVVSAVPIRPSTDNTAFLTTSNTQTAAATTNVQSPASAVVAIPAPVAANQNTLGTGILANVQSSGSGWGAAAPAKVVLAPVASSGWGSHSQSGLGSYSGLNPGLAGSNNFFNPFAAYGNGIMNTFIKPFIGYPFNGYMG